MGTIKTTVAINGRPLKGPGDCLCEAPEATKLSKSLAPLIVTCAGMTAGNL